jgi:Rieske Fe-S protein
MTTPPKSPKFNLPTLPATSDGHSRRDFCSQAILGIAGVVLSGCGGTGTGTTVDLGGSGDGGSPDMGCNNTATAGTGAVDSNLTPAAVVLGKAYLITGTKYLIGRDAGGLFAIDNVCTHAGTTLIASTGSPTIFNCPRHGSQFSVNGSVTGGPATLPLKHYAVTLTAKGTLAIDPAVTQTSAYRYCG